MINRTIGGMIRMSISIVRTATPYLVILFCALVGFSLVFHGLFYDENAVWEEFNTTMRTLFTFTLGNLDFTLFNEPDGWGMWFTIVWALISNIILLNILIAVLSGEYNNLSSKIIADGIVIMYDNWYLAKYT